MRTLINRKTVISLLFWTASSIFIIAYLVKSFKTGHILELYRDDKHTYALFSLISILTLGFCLGKLSEAITDALGLEIEKIEHFEG